MTQVKKLPRYMRRLNFIYKILMIALSVVNTGLIVLDWGNNVYYEVFCAVSTLLPVFWSKLLDETKIYIEDLTPNITPEISPTPQLQPTGPSTNEI